MSNLSITLEIAKNSLLNSQILMATTSNNIANAENPAYARQRAVMVTNPSQETAAGFLGMGARVDQIIQIRDQFVERSLITSISKQSDYEARSTSLATAGAHLLDNGDQGISRALGAFWDSWEALSQNPTGLPERTAVTQTTMNLASTIRDTANGLADTADSLEAEVQSEVGTVNNLLSQIASYNHEIRLIEGGGHTANDLRDQRFQTLTELAESLPINYREETNGTLTITIKDGDTDITLVSADESGSLSYDPENHEITYTDYEEATYNDVQLSGGRLNGLTTVYTAIGTSDATDLTYVDRLNALATTLITEVNNAFGVTVFSGSDASDMDMDESFILEPDLDPNVALSVAALQEVKLDELGGSTFSGYLSNIQQQLGLDEQNAIAQGSFQKSLRQQLLGQQQSVSGVSIDEEMIDILKFQQAYQAAAKIIQYTSEMMKTILEMV